MFKKNSLIYVSDEICSVSKEDRWFKDVLRVKTKTNNKILKHFFPVVTAVNGCEFLVTEVVTPYGEDLTDNELMGYLQHRFPEKNFDGFKSIYVSAHDTNAGTHHRVLVIYTESQKDAPIAFQDFSIPIELFIMGLSEVASKQGMENSISVVKFDNHLLLAVYTGGMLSFIVKEPFVSQEYCAIRVSRFVAFLKNDPFHKAHGPWKILVFQEVFADFQSEEMPVVRPYTKGISELLVDGLGALAETEFAEKVNVLTEEEAVLRDRTRNILSIAGIMKWVVVISLVVFAGLKYIYFDLDSQHQVLKEKAKVYITQLSQLDSTQNSVNTLLDHAKIKKSHAITGIPWSDVFNEIAAALPKGGVVQVIRVGQSDGSYVARFSVIVKGWDALAQFEQTLGKIERFSSTTVSGKKKIKGGSISASVRVEVQ